MIDLVTTLLELAAVIVLAVGAALTVSALVSGPAGVGLGVIAAGVLLLGAAALAGWRAR